MIRTKSTLIQVVQTVVETDTETVVQHFNPNGDLIMQATTPKAAGPVVAPVKETKKKPDIG